MLSSFVLRLGLLLGAACALAPARASAADLIPLAQQAQRLVAGPGCGGDPAAVARLPRWCFVPAFGQAAGGNATFWRPAVQTYRFSVPAGLQPPQRWAFVASDYTTEGRLTVVAPDGHIEQDAHFGSSVPVARRRVPTYDLRVPVPVPLERGSIFVISLISPFSGTDTLQFQSMASLHAHDDRLLRVLGLPLAFLNGGALMLALFNLVLFAVLRRRVYLIYAAAIAALVFYQIVETGAAWTLLWPNLGLRTDYPSYAAWVLYFGLIVAFTRTFLDLRTVAPRLDVALLAAYAVLVVDSLIYVLVPDLLERLRAFDVVDPLVTALMVGTMLAAGLVAWRRGVAAAPAYVIAFAGSALGISVADLATYTPALTNDPVFAYLPTSIGVAWESVFLAVALGQRMCEAEAQAVRMTDFAYRDALTGIGNRRAFDEALAREWNVVQRSSGTIAVVMFDIDHFKEFNDRYGHLAGDARLVVVARAIAASARRDADLAARYGGEEFALLLPNTSLDGAVAIAENVRHKVRALGDGGPPVTLSAGCSCATARANPAGAHALVAAADAALYDAKAGGRDRTRVAPPVWR